MAMKPRVVVIGSGMAGLSAACRLHESCPQLFELKVLEASDRIGGRIMTTQFGGDQVELGATFIHGINGSPIFNIAQRIGALQAGPDYPRCEKYSGNRSNPLVLAQGLGQIDPEEHVQPAMDFYYTSMKLVKNRDESHLLEGVSVGDFLNQRFSSFLQKTVDSSADIDAFNDQLTLDSQCRDDKVCKDEAKVMQVSNDSSKTDEKQEKKRLWTAQALQESAFKSLQAFETSISACDTLYDLDLNSLVEYKEFPGRHITIDRGYTTVLKELERTLPTGTILHGKKVEKIYWNHSHPSGSAPLVLICEDGSQIEAEHIILTVSLGVLKTSVSNNSLSRSSVCKSVQELKAWKADKETNLSSIVFEPCLPEWKIQAISKLGFGVVDKLFILLDTDADEDLHHYMQFLHHKGFRNEFNLPTWLEKMFAAFPIYKGSNVLVCWLSGDAALEMEGLSDDEVIDSVVKHFVSFGIGNKCERVPTVQDEDYIAATERVRGMIKGVLRSKWAKNCLFQGSYSFVAVGSSGVDIETLAEPLPNHQSNTVIDHASKECDNKTHQQDEFTDKEDTHPLQLLFAGEATDRHYYSTTHGAYLSGVREADRLIQHYKKLQ